MKTSLKTISFLLSVGLPATVIADFAGIQLPSALDSAHIFDAFIVALTLLTVVADYSQSAKPTAVTNRAPAEGNRVNIPENDSEHLRLAA